MRGQRQLILGVMVLGAILSGHVGRAHSSEPEPLTSSLTDGVSVHQEPLLAPDVCLPDTTPASLDTIFYGYPAGIIGADYARTLEIPTGEVLWTFQDAKMRLSDGSIKVLHNLGMVQRDNCFTLLRSGTSGNPRPWLFPDETVDRVRWFWPLDAEIGSDGQVYVYLADMRELPPPPPPPPDPDDPEPDPEPDRDYLVHTVPQGTYVARVNPQTWVVEYYGIPTDSSADLYGWSIESDRDWTYFFAQCHRQFGFDPYIFGVLAHDRSCTDRVTVARVPRGQLFDAPRYWNGSGWSPNRGEAVPIIDRVGRFANPTQFRFRNNHWMAVTKIDDWWGKTIVVEQARRPTGPFEEIARYVPATKCGADCNTYFASWVEGQNGDDGDAPMTISLSHNRWDGNATSIYRPSFFWIAPPPDVAASADRCALGHCD